METIGHCPIANKEVALDELVKADNILVSIKELIKQKHPNWDSKAGIISTEELNKFRATYVKKLLEDEKGDLSTLEVEVIDRINNVETMSKDMDSEVEEEPTFGQRLADKVAVFGGSWTFILSFGGFIFVWIIINVIFLAQKPFDPYPFILLNLILSCLAALQAPVIMMSQNRQESKDRTRSQHDYQVNLKAELEIRQLHEKIDHLLVYQSQKLLEIQQIQVKMMEQVLKNTEK